MDLLSRFKDFNQEQMKIRFNKLKEWIDLKLQSNSNNSIDNT